MLIEAPDTHAFEKSQPRKKKPQRTAPYPLCPAPPPPDFLEVGQEGVEGERKGVMEKREGEMKVGELQLCMRVWSLKTQAKGNCDKKGT